MKAPSLKKVYAVHVKFFQGDSWSAEYTYKSHRPFEVGAMVLVPDKRRLASVARVKAVQENFAFRNSINYRYIISELPVTFQELRELTND